jgi:hypothetical protein
MSRGEQLALNERIAHRRSGSPGDLIAPSVEAGSADPEVPASSSDIAGHFLGVLQIRESSLGLTDELLFGHLNSFS